MRYVLLVIVQIFCAGPILTQTLAFYADVMVNADQAQHRRFAQERFEDLFSTELETSSSLTKSYTDMPSLSIQYPRDSSFRTITWQVDHGDGKHAYGGYLQTSDNQLYKIAGPRGRSTHDTNQEISFSAWSGGLVYKIIEDGQDPSTYYLLTYRILNEFTKVKTLEPLMISDVEVTLGKQGFFENTGSNEKLNARLSLLYSIDANASIIYDTETDRLVFDNLVVVQGRLPGQGPTAVPDGSYKAYERSSNGHWTYIDKLYDHWNEGALDPVRKGKLNNELFDKKGSKKYK